MHGGDLVNAMSRDPLVVNTQDGSCWVRRALSSDGRGLYALAGSVPGVPDMVLATLRELAEHGLASMADVLPVPVGPEPQVDPVAAGRGLDLLALMDERAASVVSPVLAAVLDEAERLRTRVAELEAERHVTNDALDDAVQALRANRDQTAPTQTHPGLLVEQSHQLDPADAAFAAMACACPDGCSRDADYPGWTVHPGGGAR